MAGEATAAGAAAGTMISPGVGTVIGAGLGLAGDLLGMSSSEEQAKKNRREARRQFNVQMNESVQRRVQDALKAGINPLTALGYNGGASPTIHAGGDSGAGQYFSQMGSRAQRMMEKLTEEKVQDDVEYDRQAKELDLEGKRLENRILEQRLNAETNKPGVDMEETPSMQGEMMLFHPVYDLYGRPRLVVNQNAMEMDSDNAGYRSSMAVALKDSLMNGQISPSGRIESESLRDLIDDFYFRTTGHHITNKGELYLSPTEMYMLLGDEAKDLINSLKGRRNRGD